MWDFIVIGSGMGGAMAATQLGRAGHSVLVLESGPRAAPGGGKLSFKQKLRQKIQSAVAPNPISERWPDPLALRRSADGPLRLVRPVIGRIAGGSAALYGAALGRARRSDFERDFQPQAWLDGAPAALPNAWPVDFDAFKQCYRACERLLKVAGTPDPLDPDDDAPLLPPPPVSANTEALIAGLKANGRHPFRMHVGIDYRPGCSECQGSLCERRCKSHSFVRALEQAIDDGDVAFRTGAHVERLERGTDGHFGVVVRSDDGGAETLAARQVILAAGALNTPLILQRSGNLWREGRAPEMVGAGLMFHFGDIFAVMGASPPEGAHGPLKTIGFRDHYLDGAMPLAECQSLGMVGSPWMVGKYLEDEAIALGLGKVPLVPLAADVIGRLAAKRFAHSYLFTSNLEDLPYLANRVDSAGPSVVPGLDKIAITYRAAPELLLRARVLREHMRQAFAPQKVQFLKELGAPNLGHPMGTCRMGDDPAVSVTDPDGQVWGQPGLYVADASAFPSSLGINPALTVAANALRLAQKLAGEPAHGDPHTASTQPPTVAATFDTR
ncbi:MAG: GMC oxidoreductase [Erythrobacter sp.]